MRLKGTMKHLSSVLSFVLLALSAVAASPAPSNASLKGTYSFNYGASHFNLISNSAVCSTANGPMSYTQWFNTDKMEVIDGVMTFDGQGNVSVTATDYGRFDQASSNATLVATCNPDGSVHWTQGSAVFFPPSIITATGTYSVSSDGTGTVVLTVPGGDNPTLILRIAGGVKPVATTLLLHGLRASDNSVDGMGTAVLQ